MIANPGKRFKQPLDAGRVLSEDIEASSLGSEIAYVSPTPPIVPVHDTGRGKPSGMDAVATKRARAAIEKLKLLYLTEWAPATIDGLDRRLQLARSVPSTEPEHLEAAFRRAHDMKGQGATFGYPLITDIGSFLCAMTHDRTEATDGDFCAMLAHVEAARAVLNHRLDDPDDPTAIAIMSKLKSSVMGYLH